VLLDLLEDAARPTLKARFLSDPVGEISFADLWATSELSAAWLRDRVGAGGRVAAVFSSTLPTLSTILGAFRSGITIGSLPLPARGVSLDDYQALIEGLCALLGCELLLVDQAYVPFIPELSVRVASFQECAEGAGCAADAAPGVLVQFTSGSTARPKGIELSMEALGANVRAILEVVRPGPEQTSSFSWLPLSHDMGLVGICLSSLCAGAAPWSVQSGVLSLMDPQDFLRRPESWMQTVSDLDVTITAGPPFALGLAARTVHRLRDPDLSSLQVCITGAEPIDADVLRSYEKAFAPLGLDARVLAPAYGLAEAALAVTMVPPDTPWRSTTVDLDALLDGRWERAAKGPGSVELVGSGPPIACMELRVTGDPVGEIEIRGSSMLTRYFGEEAIRDPSTWFPTRDLGAVSDGELYVIGRLDDMFSVGGRNFFAHALEATVGAAHDAIRLGSAAVVEHRGGYVVVVEHKDATEEAMRDAANTARRQLVQQFGMGPRAFMFVSPGQVPKTPSGKLKRFHLRAALDDLEPVWQVEYKP
jgi:acyl-CoA synthetase (AMP-forming)/AMP-acid ligase II